MTLGAAVDASLLYNDCEEEMKLKAITIENFRSITESRRVPLGQVTTLIGANNEGKSNILRAIAIAVHSLNGMYTDKQRYSARLVHTSDGKMRMREDRLGYSRQWDLPLELQKKAKAATRLTLELTLTPNERARLNEIWGASPPAGDLIVMITHSDGSVQVSSPHVSADAFKPRAVKVCQFVSERFDVQYIPAVRTAGAASTIVSQLVAAELAKVEGDEKYSEALAAIAALQQPVLTSLSESLTATMRGFMPQIKKVTIAVDIATRKTALRATPEILVDDGRQTVLPLKGDGVQSIAALAIMRHASQTAKAKEDILIALEEPESHLHPHAIRELRTILYELAGRNQVVISTHNPLMTNRSELASNIIVTKTQIAPASSVAAIRDELGVRLDDNLSSSEVVLLVEGPNDVLALISILGSSAFLKGALAEGRLSVVSLGGASNLLARARFYDDASCKIHAFLDDDREGRLASARVQTEGVLQGADLNLTFCGGKTEAELEDLFEDAVYSDLLKNEAGRSLPRQGPNKAKKWSDRVRVLLRGVGRPHDDPIIDALKLRVARQASKLGIKAISPGKQGPIESLINSLEAKLGMTSS